MESGGEEGGDVLSVLFRYDALGVEVPPGRRRLVFGVLPQPGELVLVIEGLRARLVVFDEEHAPAGPVWLVAVVREVLDQF